MNLVGFLKKPRLVANPQADAASAWIKVQSSSPGSRRGGGPDGGNIPSAVAEAVAGVREAAAATAHAREYSAADVRSEPWE